MKLSWALTGPLTLQEIFARAQDLANEALREQAALLAKVRNEGRSGTLRGGTQYPGPIGPGQASPTALSSPMRPQSLLLAAGLLT